jgi:hypothetical protein
MSPSLWGQTGVAASALPIIIRPIRAVQIAPAQALRVTLLSEEATTAPL